MVLGFVIALRVTTGSVPVLSCHLREVADRHLPGTDTTGMFAPLMLHKEHAI